MKILIIGSGSKEHAIIWKLISSEKYKDIEIILAPGNPVLSKLVECIDVDINDTDRLLEIAIARNINLTIVGEAKLFSKGIVDKFRQANKNIFGPTMLAAQIESSNIFAKDLMIRHHIPCMRFAAFDNLNLALAYLNATEFPVKIRPDKVFEEELPAYIAEDFKDARRILKELFKQKFLSNQANNKVIFEEIVTGYNFTINTICDGKRALSLPPVQGYRDFESDFFDKGAYAPTPILSDRIMFKIRNEIINPTITALHKEGIDYTGLLAFDIVLNLNDEMKPKLIQYRTFLTDSDAQVTLPLLDEDLYEIMSSSANLDLSYYKDGFHKFLGSALAINIFNENGSEPSFGPEHTNIDLLNILNEEMDNLQGVIKGIPLIFYGTKPIEKHSRKIAETEIIGATAVAETLVDAQILAYKLADSISIPAKTFSRDIGDQGMI